MRTGMNMCSGVGAAAIIGTLVMSSQRVSAMQVTAGVPNAANGGDVDSVVEAASTPAALQAMGNPPCGDLTSDPCPSMFERLCGQDPAGNGGMGGIVQMCDCECGEGWWSRAPDTLWLSPSKPLSMATRTESSNSTSWIWQTSAIAQPGHVEAEASISGFSTFWHAGSRTKRATARQSTVEREVWLGTGAPCPRLVTIAATGGAMLELSLTCSASVGCAASGSATIAASCSSVGRASADIVDKTIQGTVGYSSYEHSVVIDGNFGLAITDDSVGINGKISKKVNWQLEGAGSVSGSAAYVVTPDRSYCAYTNRPIVFRSNGMAIATGGVSVDANGAASMSALALVSLAVH